MLNGDTLNRRDFLNAVAGALLSAASLDNRAAFAATRPARRWTAVQRLLDGYVADKKMAGAAAALSYDGSSLDYLSAGKIALDSTVRFDENSLCRIHSMTKPVTGVAAMMLVEDGRIALDQPVADILPEFRRLSVAMDIEKGLGSRPAVKTMTMRHLLTHTSGLSYWTPGSGAGLLPTAYRERGITPGNYGARLNRPGYGPQARKPRRNGRARGGTPALV
jgi:CubicO group peptidase (beta-lactamase class C family)